MTLRSTNTYLRDRQKLLKDLADAITRPVAKHGDSKRWLAHVMPSYPVPMNVKAYADIRQEDMCVTNYRVEVSETHVEGVLCQTFVFEGVLLKVIPV